MGLIVYPAQSTGDTQTPIINPQTSCATQNFFGQLLALFNRTGGSAGAPKIISGMTAAATFALANASSGAGGALISGDWNIFTTVASGGIAAIPLVNVGSDFIVWNFGAHSLAVTPQAIQQIDALGNGVGYPLAQNKMQWFRCALQNQMYSTQFG